MGYTIDDMAEKRKHEDTSVSLDPLTFEEAIATLAKKPAIKRTRRRPVEPLGGDRRGGKQQAKSDRGS